MDKMKDPVCGMTCDQPAGQSEYQGKTYYFCSMGCKQAFDKDPQRYLSQMAEQSGQMGEQGHHGQTGRHGSHR